MTKTKAKLIKPDPEDIESKWRHLDWSALHHWSFGDDVLLAIDEEKQEAYAVFDAWITIFRWTKNLDKWVDINRKIQSGEIEIEVLEELHMEEWYE